MPYSFPNNIPQWASKKTDAVQKVAIDVFNSTLKDTKSEEKARIASLAAMANAEKAFKDRAAGKSTVKKSTEGKTTEDYLVDILKSKYGLK